MVAAEEACDCKLPATSPELCASGHTAADRPLTDTLPPMTKRRLDSLLVERGLFDTRSRAAAAVLAGAVRIGSDGPSAAQPGQMVRDDVELAVHEAPPFVSRGGLKLANALDRLGIDPDDRRCL